MKVSCCIVFFLFCLIMPQLVFSMNEDCDQEMSYKFQNHFNEKIFDARVKDILDKVKLGKPLRLGSMEYYVSHLPAKYTDLEREAQEELKRDLPDCIAKKIPILEFSRKPLSFSAVYSFLFGETEQGTTIVHDSRPCAILINTGSTETDRIKFNLFREVGRVKFYLNNDKKSEEEIFADLYALYVFARKYKDGNHDLNKVIAAIKPVWRNARPEIYLQSHELDSCLAKIYNEIGNNKMTWII